MILAKTANIYCFATSYAVALRAIGDKREKEALIENNTSPFSHSTLILS